MKTLKQIAQEAAQEVLDQNWVEIDEDIADSEPVSILAWEMGEGIGYETALREIVMKRAGSIVQVIYSYNTPIAWLDAGQWIVPQVSYSPTTGKHQSYLWPLNGEIIPWDCALNEYMRIMNAQMRLVQDGGRLITKPGHRWS